MRKVPRPSVKTSKTPAMSEQDEDEFEEIEIEELLPTEISTEPRPTYPIQIIYQYAKSPNDLTKYERSAVLGKRAVELANNAPPTITDLPPSREPIDIARAELEVLKLPEVIKREIPNWKITYLFLNVPDEFTLRTPEELSFPETEFIIRQRAAELASGARTTLLPNQIPPNATYQEIARRELSLLKLPGIFKRQIPGRGEITIYLSKKF